MKYLMLVTWNADAMNERPDPTPEELAQLDDESFPWLDDVQARGVRLDGDMLAPPRMAATVRVRDGRQVVTEGPFIETKEAIGGFDILECESMEEAIKIAAAHPVAANGAIEVRPFYGS
ncbi:MAG TPA: YciI family protein [Jatrophihabitans sp.]|nr:YciI family protein [Jatrophihabitans sp.]